jgi:hypothetical protein
VRSFGASAVVVLLAGTGALLAVVPGAAAGTAVQLKGTYVLDGAVSKTGSFVNSELVRSSCAQIGSKGTGTDLVGKDEFALPSPLPVNAASKNISFTASVMYHGPGTYSKEDILKGGGTDLIVGTNSYNAVATTAKASMTVKANASGTFTFSGATPVKKGPSLSGKVTWSCAG